MTGIAASVWNKVAETQRLVRSAARTAFLLTDQQLAVMEDFWYASEKEAGMEPVVASCLVTCLPLLAERKALSRFRQENPELASALPELLDPQETAILMRQEYRLTLEQQARLQAALQSPLHLQR